MEKTKRIKLSLFAAIISLATLLMFHWPFFRHVVNNVEEGFNGIMLTVCLVILLLVLNFFACYLFLYLLRGVGKTILALSFIGNAITLYFINTYDVLVDDTMMGNVFNTDYSEATSYYSGSALLYILLLGVLPCVLIILTKVDYGSFKRFLKNIGVAVALALVLAFSNMTNWPWVDKNAPVIGSLLMPWSYTVNAVRYQNHLHQRNRQEILLPDATIANDEKDALVLVIGESARRDHFSLYGYERETNPLLSKVEGLKTYVANSNATYTTAGVKAILDYTDTDKLYEILPNYLYRTGVDVIWRTTNSGEPPLHIEKCQRRDELSELSGINPDYDEVLLHDLKNLIEGSDKSKVVIFLHTSTCHGPLYSRKYPPQFEKYTPVSTSVEMSKCPQDQLYNGYDNTILYTDWMLDRVIGELSSLEGWNTCMMYVSDHGESLGEGNLYMHGVPIKLAPKEQYEIPFLVWTSDGRKLKDFDLLNQNYVFHTVLDFIGVESPIYNKEFDLFE